MVQVPAYCRNCGAMFAVGLPFGIPAGSTGTLRGNVANCPNCGGDAQLLEGHVEFQKDSVKLLSGSQFNADLLNAFSLLVKEAFKTGDIEKLEKEAEKIHPDLGKVVSSARAKNSSVLVALTLLLLILKQCNIELKLDAKVDLNQLYTQLTTESDADKPKKDEGSHHASTAGNGTSEKNPKIGH